MKIKIEADGLLSIERVGHWRKQKCPYRDNGTHCGDWCPLFGEPHEYDGRQALNLCMSFLEGEITDERGVR